jgi:hypothetical protein
VTFPVYWAVTSHGFDQQQPVALRIKQNYIRHFAVCINVDAEFSQRDGVEITPLLASVSSIDQYASGNETRREILNNLPDQIVVPFRRVETA